MLRIVTGVVLLVLLWLLVPAPPIVFLAVATLFISMAAWESYRMLAGLGEQPFTALGIVTIWAIIWSFAGRAPEFDASVPLVVATLATVCLALLRRGEPRAVIDACCGTLFPVLFIGLTLAHLVALRFIESGAGVSLLLLLFACVILNDTSAYYVGSMIGKRPLAPRLSPKKTWEGAIAGVVGSVAAAVGAGFWLRPAVPLGHAVALGLLLGVTAILGDLAESSLKRASNVKDSSRLLPGHGGVLDRSDSLLLTAPILYYYYLLFLEGKL